MVNKDPDINEELSRLVQPYSEAAEEQLKKALKESPGLKVVHVWRHFHLDDIELYKICKDLSLKFVFDEMEFSGMEHAAAYICRKQLRRKDLLPEYKKYIIGQLYLYECAVSSSVNSNDSMGAIADEIAADLFIAMGTVRKYGQYAAAMNIIFDQDPVFARSILSGRIKLSHENTVELSRLRSDEIRAVAKTSMEENLERITLSFIRNEAKWSHIKPTNPVSRREMTEQKISSKQNIRQMPQYDPDSEVNSLCLTIDSWISSMQRVKNSESFPKITYTASLKLMKKLTVLENTINIIQDSLVERTNP